MNETDVGNYEYMKYIMASIMDMGEILLTHGAEVSRIEDTIGRLCKAYGFARWDVFTITSSVIVTATLADGRTITQTRRIRERDTDLGRVEKVNALSRKICEHPLSLEQFSERDAGDPGKEEDIPAFTDGYVYDDISIPFCFLWRNSKGWSGGISFRCGAVCNFIWKCRTEDE